MHEGFDFDGDILPDTPADKNSDNSDDHAQSVGADTESIQTAAEDWADGHRDVSIDPPAEAKDDVDTGRAFQDLRLQLGLPDSGAEAPGVDRTAQGANSPTTNRDSDSEWEALAAFRGNNTETHVPLHEQEPVSAGDIRGSDENGSIIGAVALNSESGEDATDPEATQASDSGSDWESLDQGTPADSATFEATLPVEAAEEPVVAVDPENTSRPDRVIVDLTEIRGSTPDPAADHASERTNDGFLRFDDGLDDDFDDFPVIQRGPQETYAAADSAETSSSGAPQFDAGEPAPGVPYGYSDGAETGNTLDHSASPADTPWSGPNPSERPTGSWTPGDSAPGLPYSTSTPERPSYPRPENSGFRPMDRPAALPSEGTHPGGPSADTAGDNGVEASSEKPVTARVQEARQLLDDLARLQNSDHPKAAEVAAQLAQELRDESPAIILAARGAQKAVHAGQYTADVYKIGAEAVVDNIINAFQKRREERQKMKAGLPSGFVARVTGDRRTAKKSQKFNKQMGRDGRRRK